MNAARVCALLCALLGTAALADDCTRLNGVYEYQSAAPRDGHPEYLSSFVHGPERNKLFRRETATAPKGLSSSAPISRPKITHLATKVRVEYGVKGTRFHFLDAQGKEIAAAGIDTTDKWRCKGGKLERSSRRTAGLGDVINTERVEETFARDAEGHLVYTETVTVIEPPGGKSRRSEAKFRAAQAAA